jgi:hypothetical protein
MATRTIAPHHDLRLSGPAKIPKIFLKYCIRYALIGTAGMIRLPGTIAERLTAASPLKS